MGMNSILSTGSVVGGASIVVGEAEASLRMLKSLRQFEEAAEASYQVNLGQLEKQCQIVGKKLEEEENKVHPVENAIKHYGGELESLQNMMDRQRSLIRETSVALSSVPAGNSNEERRSCQARKEILTNKIRELEAELGKMEEHALALKRHLEKIGRLRREVEENVKLLTEADRQVRQEKETYASEGRIAIARLRDEAEQNERTCQNFYNVVRERTGGR